MYMYSIYLNLAHYMFKSSVTSVSKHGLHSRESFGWLENQGVYNAISQRELAMHAVVYRLSV